MKPRILVVDDDTALAEMLTIVLRGEGFAEPNPQPMFPNPPGLLRLEPHSSGLRDRIWWGAASAETAPRAASPRSPDRSVRLSGRE